MLLLSAANLTFLLISAVSPYAADCLVTATAQTLHLLLVQAQQSPLIMHWTLGLGLALAIARASADLDEVPSGVGDARGTLYTVLGVTTASSNDEIRQAYEAAVAGVMAEKNQSFFSRLLWNPFSNPNPRAFVDTPESSTTTTSTTTTHGKRETDTDTDPRTKMYKIAYETLTHPYTRCVYHRETNLPEWTGRVPQSCWKQRVVGWVVGGVVFRPDLNFDVNLDLRSWIGGSEGSWMRWPEWERSWFGGWWSSVWEKVGGLDSPLGWFDRVWVPGTSDIGDWWRTAAGGVFDARGM
ncbi:hypothetical protein B0J18DRAFT_441687 [Chaetomium sp. MPI-SDFR-AT-0129]|nr:hypothetical protein B0J18DRAFT_441687 [Chaetomium sp. MPI-SDFR-AT-0129]